MSYWSVQVVSRNSVIPAINTLPPIEQELTPTEQKFILEHLETWFADLERSTQPETAEANPYLATQFLSRFGLKNALDVFKFLKTAGGDVTLTMIVREIIKEELRIQSISEQNTAEMLRQQRLLFMLMGIIAQRKELAKNVDQLIRFENDKHLKSMHMEQKTETLSERPPVTLIDEMIDHYIETMKVLDEELDEIEDQLDHIEEELNEIEEEERRVEELHSHIEILDTFLQLPILQHPQENPAAFVQRRITSLMRELERYKEQEAQFKNKTTGDIRTQEMEKNRLGRHIRTIEHELNFHKVHLNPTVTNFEDLFHLALQQTRGKIQELQSQQSVSGQVHVELEGLQLRERGLLSALKVMRNKKILLNDQLEQVFDFSQARFSIKPEDARRLVQRKDGSYALLPKDADPENLIYQDWVQAQIAFEQAKAKIQTPRFNFMEKIQENLQRQRERKEHHLSLREVLQAQRMEMQNARKEMGEALKGAQAQRALLLKRDNLSPNPNPSPDFHESYSQMREKFEFLALKKPQKKDLDEVRNLVKNSSISPEVKGKLDQLIEQADNAPGKNYGATERLRFLRSARQLLKDVSPALDMDSTLRKKD